MTKNIDLIVGARPNFIKAFPLLKALKNSKNYVTRLINTGQHYDSNMVDIFFTQLGVNSPDINLNIGSGTHGMQTGRTLIEIENVFLNSMPDMVIVFGDVNSTLAGALAASKLNIPISHIESGLRSFDRTMPEEINRILTDQLSDLLFTTSPEAEKNLLDEGKTKEQIFFVGNTMIDSLVKFNHHFNSKNITKSLSIKNKNYILITMHRPSNVDNVDKFSSFIDAINETGKKIPIIWPIHPRITNLIKSKKYNLNSNIHTIKPKGYLEFMGLQKNAKLIITDSGGVQEESTYFGVPCFTIRENTERPVTITNGSNHLIGTDFKKLNDLIFDNSFLKKNLQRPKFWDGNSSQRIISIINSFFDFN